MILANQKGHRKSNEPIKTRSKYMKLTQSGNLRKARENYCERVTIGFGFTLDWLKSGASFISQSYSVLMQNQLLFDTEMKPL